MSEPVPAKQIDTVLGVERDKLERFLELIRDSYPRADQATFFIEAHTDTANIVAITNLRDILSHLATFLTPGLDPQKRSEQIVNAQEHFRRAILEPYEITVREKLKHLKELLEKYKTQLLPVVQKYTVLASAPSEHMISSRLKAIRELTEKGRLAKGNNDWNEKWERGVSSYVEAFNQVCQLNAEIEDYWFKFEQTVLHKHEHSLHGKGHRLHYAGLAVGLLALAIAAYDHRGDLLQVANRVLRAVHIK